MVTPEERMKILQMLQDGKISPEAAAQLLDAMGQEAPEPQSARTANAAQFGRAENRSPFPQQEPLEPGAKARWLRVRVTDTDSGRPRVNVRMPISLVNLGLKLGAHFTPEVEGIDMAALLQAAQMGEAGPFVDVYDEDEGEHVEVFLD